SRIMTGGPLPDGADAVVMQERTRSAPAEAAEVEVLEPVSAGNFVRGRGEDARQGELLLAKGTPIGIPEAALLWAQAITQVAVPRRPRVAILATGDELCPVDEPSGEKVIDSNSPALVLAVRRAGAIPSPLGIARDNLEDVVRKLARAQDYDVVLTSAGVSVGEHDFVKDALHELGVEMNFWRVAIKPGKPLAVGQKGATLFFGLPGNPTSSMVSFELFVRPALRRMLGHSAVRPTRVRGRCAVELRKGAGLSHFVRVTAEWRDGDLWARPLESQTSGALRSAVGATHLMLFPEPSTFLATGDPVELLPVSWAP
ncbi:MAG TPA: molybdopterin molybdotransferase MoeA, partial [Myxococcaceae bacterium]|nr:molybdopterin molybdotransferase MoeA [Myxococcaceae bacterium]